jgi:hypothetical protein
VGSRLVCVHACVPRPRVHARVCGIWGRTYMYMYNNTHRVLEYTVRAPLLYVPATTVPQFRVYR